MKKNTRYRAKPVCNVTIEFAPSDPSDQYTDDKKRTVLKIIFEGFEKGAKR